MTVQAIQTNNTKSQKLISSKKEVRSYLDETTPINTDNLIKPLPPRGHLIHDNLLDKPKYFIKDIQYDLKSLKNGFLGTANDHQLGRLNDIGLKLGGLSIATYLAANTVDPKVRMMEYVGLGTFLTVMDLYPKLAIYAPSQLRFGFNVGKEYIDDQGRKKSVLQDGNYIPFDMYRGEYKDEDLDKIADNMGISKRQKNRKELAKEHIRKVAIQNQTLWMMTGGVATPVFTALICSGLEKYIVGPGIEKARNIKHKNTVSKLLQKTNELKIEMAENYSNSLSRKVSKLLSKYKDAEIPKEEYEKLIQLLTENLDTEATEGIKSDIKKVLERKSTGTNYYVVNVEKIEDALDVVRFSMKRAQREKFEKTVVPTKKEVLEIISEFVKDGESIESSVHLNTEDMVKIKTKLRALIDKKINKKFGNETTFANVLRTELTDLFDLELKNVKSFYVSNENLEKIVNFSKALGEFNNINKQLQSCESFKFENTTETILARSYEKFEKTFLDSLNFTIKDLKVMRESDEYAAKMIDNRLTKLAKNEFRYKKVMTKLCEIINDMETKLHGTSEKESVIKDLLTAYETNYFKFAQRLEKIDKESFGYTITKLIAEKDLSKLEPTFKNVDDVKAWMDDMAPSRVKALTSQEEIAAAHSKGVGSSKDLLLSRLRFRYSGVRNSFNRVLHLMDFYKRSIKPEEFANDITILSHDPSYISEIIKKGKTFIMTGYTTDFISKNFTTNNPELYKDFMNTVYSSSSDINGLGHMDNITKEILSKSKTTSSGNLEERFGRYLTRFRNIFVSDEIDFLKAKHFFDSFVRNEYIATSYTSDAKFNLVAKNPMDMIKEASVKSYAKTKWFKTVSGIAGGVIATVALFQLQFGKINKSQRKQRQVRNVAN